MKAPIQVPIFRVRVFPFPHPHPGQCCHTNLAKPTRGASLFSLFCRASARARFSNPPAGRSAEGKESRCPGLGDHPHRPRISLGGAAHSGGGRAARSSTEKPTPRRLLGPGPPPGSQRVKPGYKGGPASPGPTPRNLEGLE